MSKHTHRIERTSTDGWVQSSTYLGTFTSSEAQDIVESGNANQQLGLRYRAVLVPEPVRFIVEADIRFVNGKYEFAPSINDSKEYDTFAQAQAAVERRRENARPKGYVNYRVGVVNAPAGKFIVECDRLDSTWERSLDAPNEYDYAEAQRLAYALGAASQLNVKYRVSKAPVVTIVDVIDYVRAEKIYVVKAEIPALSTIELFGTDSE
jgi:hypothetical protein